MTPIEQPLRLPRRINIYTLIEQLLSNWQIVELSN